MTVNTPIPFDVERLNVGGAMKSTTGIFTAPRDGIYSFSFTGLAYLPASSSRVRLIVEIYLNDNFIGYAGYADEDNTTGQFETFSHQSAYNLTAGDKIWVQIYDMPTGAYLRGYYYTYFSGYLVEEIIPVA